MPLPKFGQIAQSPKNFNQPESAHCPAYQKPKALGKTAEVVLAHINTSNGHTL